ncbi:MAG: tetratricopeptide repeat protein [Candidatus Poribacteria bacterium]|nr:tetratricopeptide repeat protein [Candidatus Poribacteria bacterium]
MSTESFAKEENKAAHQHSVYARSVELYNEGLSYAKHERFNEALSLLTEAVKLAPDYIKAHNLLGKIYMQLGQIDKARESWLKTLKLDPLNLMAMECLEASEPKSLLGGFRDWVLFLPLLLVLIGGTAIYWKLIKPELSDLNNNLSQLESKLDNIAISSPALSDQPSLRKKTEDLLIPDKKTNPNSDIDNNKTSQPIAKTDKTLSTNLQISNVSDQLPVKSTTPSKVTNRSDLEQLYNQTVKGLVLVGKYQSALPNLIMLTESGIEHRYVLGNSFFWLGVCYRNLDQTVEAMRAFQYVTQSNSFKYDEARAQIRTLQQDQRRGFH